MRWPARRERDPSGWRRWFAWYPVRIGAVRVWLEVVERRPVPGQFLHPSMMFIDREYRTAID